MKLRFEDNTLRLRLSTEELATFGETGHLVSHVPLAPGPEGTLTYALQRAPDDSTAAAETLRVAYLPGHLTVLVPETIAHNWVASEEISLSATIRVADATELRILVEKDLGCRH